MIQKKKRVTKEPYEGYALPKSSNRGEPFVDWNEVMGESIGIKPKRTVKKRRKKYGNNSK